MSGAAHHLESIFLQSAAGSILSAQVFAQLGKDHDTLIYQGCLAYAYKHLLVNSFDVANL